MFSWEDNNKEFICRQCSTYLDAKDLIDGNCPNCGTEEDIFINENEDEEE